MINFSVGSWACRNCVCFSCGNNHHDKCIEKKEMCVGCEKIVSIIDCDGYIDKRLGVKK